MQSRLERFRIEIRPDPKAIGIRHADRRRVDDWLFPVPGRLGASDASERRKMYGLCILN
jgi:hypothetical protein